MVYNFTYTNGGISATGTLDVTGGVATSGFISITGAAIPDGTYSLGTPSVIRSIVGDDEIFDNLVNPAGPQFIVSTDGLGFSSPILDGFPHAFYILNIWGNSPTNYAIYDAGAADKYGTGRVYQVVGGGSFTLTEAVPDGGATLALFGCALFGLGALHRRFSA